MTLRKRQYLSELTTMAAVPSVVKAFTVRRKVFPSLLAGIVDNLDKTKKRLARKLTKKISPPGSPKL
jgi:hypothetical protein